MAGSPDGTARSCVEVWLPLSSSVPMGRDSCGGHPPHWEKEEPTSTRRRSFVWRNAVWSLSPAYSRSLSPRELTARLCPWLPVARTHCRAHPCPGPASHHPDYTLCLCLSPRTTSDVCLVLAMVVRVSSLHRARVCTRLGARLAFRWVQTPTWPLCPGDQPWAPVRSHLP